MKRKMVAMLLVTSMAMTALAGCGGSKETKEETPAKEEAKEEVKEEAQEEAPAEEAAEETAEGVTIKVGWAPPNITGVFETAENNMNKAIEDAKSHGINIELTTVASPDETQYENQVKAIENLVQSEMDVIICSPGSLEAVQASLEDATNKGIPVILVNTGADVLADNPWVSSIIGFDNVDGGAVSGYALLDQLGGPGVVAPGEEVTVEPGTYLDRAWWEETYKDFDYSTISGKVAVIEGIAGSYYSNARLEGFHSVVDQCENLEVVSTLAGDWDREKGTKAAENILQANDELDAIWAASNEMGIGAAIVTENVGRTDVLVSTNDGTPESVDMIRNGKLVTETWHGFPEWGWYGIQFATELALGQADKVPQFFDIRPRTEYKGNADMFYPETKLEPIPWDDILANAK